MRWKPYGEREKESTDIIGEEERKTVWRKE